MMTFHTPFTGLLNGVNRAGRTLGNEVPLLSSRESIRTDAMSQGWLGGLSTKSLEGRLIYGDTKMKINKRLLGLGIALAGTTLLPDMAFAHDGAHLGEEITAIENLLTGGYARIALVAMTIGSAVLAAAKQNIMGAVICVGAGVFVHLMLGWVTSTFTMVC